MAYCICHTGWAHKNSSLSRVEVCLIPLVLAIVLTKNLTKFIYFICSGHLVEVIYLSRAKNIPFQKFLMWYTSHFLTHVLVPIRWKVLMIHGWGEFIPVKFIEYRNTLTLHYNYQCICLNVYILYIYNTLSVVKEKYRVPCKNILWED